MTSKKGSIRIIVRSFEHKLIDEAVRKIVTTAKDS
jgi:ribosomal protein S10